MKARRRKAKTDGKDPWTTDPRSPLELLSSLLGGSTYRIPVEGKGSKAALSISEIAGAVGYMPNRLNREVAMAVAMRTDPRLLLRIAALAHRKITVAVSLQRPPPLNLHQDADRFRLRLVSYHALSELVHPETRQPYSKLAREAKMRKATYITVHRCATAVLQDALSSGSTEFGEALWGRRF